MKQTSKGRRYGFDTLSLGLLFVSVLLNGINFLPFVKEKNILGILALFPLLLCILRMISTNVEARKKENRIFVSILSIFSSRREDSESNARKSEKKLFKFFKCPNCGQKVRVPRGKGKVEILCPKCANKFIKKT